MLYHAPPMFGTTWFSPLNQVVPNIGRVGVDYYYHAEHYPGHHQYITYDLLYPIGGF